MNCANYLLAIEVAAPWETWPGWQPQWGWNWPAGSQPVAGPKVPPSKGVFGFPTAFSAAETPPTIDYNHGAPSSHQVGCFFPKTSQ